MQTVSAGFATAAAAAGRRPVHYVEVSWDNSGAFSGARGSSGWTDETTYVERHYGTLRINPPGERLIPAGDVGRATVILDNRTWRYSWQRPTAALYADIGGATGLMGKMIRIWVGFLVSGSPEYVCVFSGYISGWSEDAQGGTVTLECRDRGWRLLQDKRSTAVSQNQLPNAWIEIVMGLAGFTSAHWSLDIGIYPIPYCWMDDESVVDEIWDAAAADGGVAYFDQLGILRFENLLHWPTDDTVRLGISAASYDSISQQMMTDDVATRVVVEWQSRNPGPDADIYTLDVPKVVAPGGSLEWTARFNYAALSVYTPDSGDPYNDYRAVSYGGADLTSSLTLTLSNVSGQQCTIIAANGDATRAALISALRLRGVPLLGGPTEQTEYEISPAPLEWNRVRSERGNPYVQTLEQGSALASVLGLRSSRIRALYRLANLRQATPALELTDRVEIYSARSLTGNPREGIVVQIGWRYSLDDGYKQDLLVMDVEDLAEYTDYFQIGVTALGSGRAYY